MPWEDPVKRLDVFGARLLYESRQQKEGPERDSIEEPCADDGRAVGWLDDLLRKWVCWWRARIFPPEGRTRLSADALSDGARRVES